MEDKSNGTRKSCLNHYYHTVMSRPKNKRNIPQKDNVKKNTAPSPESLFGSDGGRSFGAACTRGNNDDAPLMTNDSN